MAGSRPILRAIGLAVSRGDRTVFSGVDLELRLGEVVAVLGPNGAGKSSLVSALCGLLELDAGSVECDGRVAAVMQGGALANRTAAANVEAALAWWGVPRSDRASRSRDALAKVGAAELADRAAATLSGGEARRVHLARGLALKSEVLLLDEPFAGVDAPTRARLLQDFGSVLRSPDRATLVVVHDRAEAWALADRVVVLLDGVLAAEGATAEVMQRPPTEKVARFLGFTGRLTRPDGGVLITRTGDVRIDPDAGERGTVTSLLLEEEGVVCDVRLARGTVQVRAAYPGPAVGDTVALSIDTGSTFVPGGAE